MGVIAPEPKSSKKSVFKKKNSTNFISLGIFLFFFVVLPVLAINLLSSQKKPVYNLNSIESADFIDEEKATQVKNRVVESYNTGYTRDKDGLFILSAPVMDTAHVFNSTEYNELNNELYNFSKENGIQIVVLTLKTLNGKTIEDVSMNYCEKWKLGQKGIDNGVLLTIAMDEHDVRIETGYGSEGVLTDALCSRIIRNVLIPSFQKGNYYQGVLQACRSMEGILTSDESLISNNLNSFEDDVSTGDAVAGFIIVFIIVVITLIILSSSARRHAGPFIYVGPTHHHHSSGFGGGSSFGGGFGGFSGGGGGFGGGGASGHW